MAPLRSAKSAGWILDRLPGIIIPDALDRVGKIAYGRRSFQRRSKRFCPPYGAASPAPRQAQTRRNSMRHIISASLFALSCALAPPASAQLEGKPVPMDKAPFHIPVFPTTTSSC
jgi:hypothetical protein